MRAEAAGDAGGAHEASMTVLRAGEVEPGIFLVQRVLEHRVTGAGDVELLVQWQGWTVAQSRWEPLATVGRGTPVVRAYQNAQHKSAKRAMLCNGSAVSTHDHCHCCDRH